MCLRASCCSSSSVGAAPRGEITAVTFCPQRSSGVATTSASNTAGWFFSACSTSSGKIFSPPLLMQFEPRPNTVIEPSISSRAESPVSSQRLPSTVTKVLAVFTGSLK